MKLSPHFSLQEATRSDTAARLGIDNVPNHSQLQNLIYTANKLELVRAGLNLPNITVNSWLRIPELNAAIPGSSRTSSHQDGFAVDVVTRKYTPYEFASATHRFLLHENIDFDQIIHEYGSWMHISFAPAGRRQTLTIFKNSQGKRYINGILTKEEYHNA